MLTVFLCSFLFVAMKSFQQLNVQHDRKLWVVPTSLLMAYMEVTIVFSIVKSDSWWTALPLGIGAGLGCLLAMTVHRSLRNARQLEGNNDVSND